MTPSRLTTHVKHVKLHHMQSNGRLGASRDVQYSIVYSQFKKWTSCCFILTPEQAIILLTSSQLMIPSWTAKAPWSRWSDVTRTINNDDSSGFTIILQTFNAVNDKVKHFIIYIMLWQHTYTVICNLQYTKYFHFKLCKTYCRSFLK